MMATNNSDDGVVAVRPWGIRPRRPPSWSGSQRRAVAIQFMLGAEFKVPVTVSSVPVPDFAPMEGESRHGRNSF